MQDSITGDYYCHDLFDGKIKKQQLPKKYLTTFLHEESTDTLQKKVKYLKNKTKCL